MERRKPLTANVGIVSVGLDTYWKQCPGLLDDMVKKEDVFVRKCEAHQVKISRFGMSDNPIAAKAMIPAMKAADLDVLFVDMVTYATSSTFAPFVRELNVPIVLFALQPDERLDYEHATIYKQLLNDDLCSVPEFTVPVLLLMVAGGIGGGIAGRAINKHIDSRAVDKLFLVLMGVIILISFYNTWRYLSL